MPDGFFFLSYDLHHIATKTKKETLALRVVILMREKSKSLVTSSKGKMESRPGYTGRAKENNSRNQSSDGGW